MRYNKQLKIFSSPAVNILLGIVLLSTFIFAGQNIIQTYSVASMTALNNLKPVPFDYLWNVSTNKAVITKNKIRTYADYYEHMLKVFPNLWDAYSVLGYCYHYLGDDAKAIDYLKIGIDKSPLNLWNYYNLAMIEMNESHYSQAAVLLRKALAIAPKDTLMGMFRSQFVYLPLLDTEGSNAINISIQRLNTALKDSYILLRLMNESEMNKNMVDVFKKLNLELHAI